MHTYVHTTACIGLDFCCVVNAYIEKEAKKHYVVRDIGDQDHKA